MTDCPANPSDSFRAVLLLTSSLSISIMVVLFCIIPFLFPPVSSCAATLDNGGTNPTHIICSPSTIPSSPFHQNNTVTSTSTTTIHSNV